MYEDKTYENILAEMLSKVPDSMDKSEGSVIWLGVAPAAYMLAQAFLVAGNIYKELSGDTASRETLINLAKDTKGMTPKPATPAWWRVKVDPDDINAFKLINTDFVCGQMILKVWPKTNDGIWIAQCKTAGMAGNSIKGALIPVKPVNGLKSIELVELISPGKDEEDTEAFRERWRASFKEQEYGGSKAYYKSRIKAIDGVGGVKIYRAENEAGEKVGGHVRCVMTAANHTPPAEELVSKVQQIIDPTLDGEGDGEACFGHIVHIMGAEECQIELSATFIFEDGISFDDKKENITEAVEKYFSSLRALFEDSDYITVRISQIERSILDVEGVVDISNTHLNGSTSNYILQPNQVPILMSITEDANE